MIKRTVYISNPAYLKLKHNQLIIQEPDSKMLKGSIPIEDIAIVLLDHPQITITQQVMQSLMGYTVALISCDAHHLPNGLMLPLDGHTELTERWRAQLNASLPLKKQLWKQTILAKIENQKAVLKQYQKPVASMDFYLEHVTSGDERNMEGKAANHYWKHLLNDFQRTRFGESPNNYLNYGYAILRSMVARAIVSSGLLPAQGIFHRNKYNSYCLADDLMEPYRPYVDQWVVNWITKHPTKEKITPAYKKYILGIATQDVCIDGRQKPLMIAISTTTASTYKCFTGENRIILYPTI